MADEDFIEIIFNALPKSYKPFIQSTYGKAIEMTFWCYSEKIITWKMIIGIWSLEPTMMRKFSGCMWRDLIGQMHPQIPKTCEMEITTIAKNPTTSSTNVDSEKWTSRNSTEMQRPN